MDEFYGKSRGINKFEIILGSDATKKTTIYEFDDGSEITVVGRAKSSLFRSIV